jgi:hypothetical protein
MVRESGSAREAIAFLKSATWEDGAGDGDGCCQSPRLLKVCNIDSQTFCVRTEFTVSTGKRGNTREACH